jgi:hypothetical protein
MAVICTWDGRAAREFRAGVEAGIVGVHVPVAQPFAFFPFSGGRGRSTVTSMCMGPMVSSSIRGRRCSSLAGEDTGSGPHGGAGAPPPFTDIRDRSPARETATLRRASRCAGVSGCQLGVAGSHRTKTVLILTNSLMP